MEEVGEAYEDAATELCVSQATVLATIADSCYPLVGLWV